MSSDLPAGPELDALIATRVMGWIRHDLSSGAWSWFPDISVSPPPLSLKGWGSGWSPSTIIVHAWEVVEKLRANNYSFTVGWSGDPAIGWEVTVDGHGRRIVHRGLEDKTGCVQICRAALLIVGEDPDGL